jgi:predicted DNA-binding protein (UPF0251 family)
MNIGYNVFLQGCFMEILNLEETARYLGISKRRIQTILKNGLMKGKKVDRTWVINIKDVEEFDKTRHRKDNKITIEEAAKLLKTSSWWIRGMHTLGKISVESRNGVIFIDPKSLL